MGSHDRRAWLTSSLLMMGLASGCSKHPGAYETATGAQEDATAILAKGEALWKQRLDEGKLQESIGTFESALEKDANSRKALERLVRGWYFWGDAFTEDEETQRERYSRAIEYGTQCLALNEGFRTAIANGEKEKDAAVYAKKEAVPCLYWTASALGKWGNTMSIATRVKHIGTVKAYMTKVEELDPTYYNHGPARYWGAYYTLVPSFMGKDLDKAADYFEKSVEGSPFYLPTRVLRAQDWAVNSGDVAQFDEDLVYVLAANPNENPDADVMPENVKEQEKARKLFERRAELFDKKAIEEAGPAPEMPAPYQPPAEPAPPAPEEGSGDTAGTTEGAPDDSADDSDSSDSSND